MVGLLGSIIVGNGLMWVCWSGWWYWMWCCVGSYSGRVCYRWCEFFFIIWCRNGMVMCCCVVNDLWFS